MKQRKSIKLNNQKTLLFLKRQGYPLRYIRRALCILSEIEDADMARPLGISRASVQLYINGLRHVRPIQEAIAAFLHVNREDLFTEER